MSKAPSPSKPSGHKRILPAGVPPPQNAMANSPPQSSSSAGRSRAPLRVPHACNLCRKLKMRCEGPSDPPCNRCRGLAIPCVFEKVTKSEAEGGVSQRIKDLENRFSSMEGTMQEILVEIRRGSSSNIQSSRLESLSAPSGADVSSPTAYHGPSSSPYHRPSNVGEGSSTGSVSAFMPGAQSYPDSQYSPYQISTSSTSPGRAGSPSSSSTHSHSQNHQLFNSNIPGISHSRQSQSHGLPPLTSMLSPPPGFSHLLQSNQPPVGALGLPTNTALPQPLHNTLQSQRHTQHGFHAPYSSMAALGTSSMRTRPASTSENTLGETTPTSSSFGVSTSRFHPPPTSPMERRSYEMTTRDTHTQKRRLGSTASATSSDDEGDIPSSALLAPIEVLNDIASVAAGSPDEAPRSHLDRHFPKKRKRDSSSQRDQSGLRVGVDAGGTRNKSAGSIQSTRIDVDSHRTEKEFDVVEKGILSEDEAKELYTIYFSGCYRLLAVFDPARDTYESIKSRSPLCFCAILMVASKVRDGGGPPSELHNMLAKECVRMARETMFRESEDKAINVEAIDAMLLIAGWSHSTGGTGWLTAGHAIRCAVELGLHKALPRLAKKTRGRPATGNAEADGGLIVAARTWCALYVFEYQISFGTGRPAMMRGDKSLANAREILLKHPLSIATDHRLVSTCELLSLQAKIHEDLGPHDEPVNEPEIFGKLQEASRVIDDWFTEWDGIMGQEHPAGDFFRSSAAIQRAYANLFHHCIALRELKTAADVKSISPGMKGVVLAAIREARECIDICVNNGAYREGLRYAVAYTHTCAAFAGAFLLRFARLFPSDLDVMETVKLTEELASILSEVPAGHLARSLRDMVSQTRSRLNDHARSASGNRTRSGSSQTTPPSYPEPSPQFTNDFVQLIHPTPIVPPLSQPPPFNDQALADDFPDVSAADLFQGLLEYPAWIQTSMLGDLMQGQMSSSMPPDFSSVAIYGWDL
ncbi:hypothetical protein BOTBODRAFT_182777 [Botryobasidium botryosum FD-172 SS1]|uniref:Zn(2)-C6 fungal-type domain-containing protein n=1 Tax=Botryobasidium botryosum (strain FD-172 SS1) TaxID=930990 RepID=A0A067NCE7_BOTB1|nr:hypothetical protein BOTBODRAFT_182777 [Botryobasidium botryosum FD-172 SS1]